MLWGLELLLLPFSIFLQERKLKATLAARADAREADAALLSGAADEEEARHLRLARKHAQRAEELAAGLVEVSAHV